MPGELTYYAALGAVMLCFTAVALVVSKVVPEAPLTLEEQIILANARPRPTWFPWALFPVVFLVGVLAYAAQEEGPPKTLFAKATIRFFWLLCGIAAVLLFIAELVFIVLRALYQVLKAVWGVLLDIGHEANVLFGRPRRWLPDERDGQEADNGR